MLVQFETATGLLSLLASREISCLELLRQYIDHIEKHDPDINAVVCRDFERALVLAAEADRGRSGTSSSCSRPLLGLPITVKESFDVAGLPTTWGMPAYRNNIASRHAEAVERLVEAGAIVFGKTNVPTALADSQTFNPVFGTTNNPWDHRRTSGGSSGGSAAALAAGFTSLELGSDLAGSLRTPAHFCGVFSHKPSYGIISQSGHSIRADPTQPDLSVVGPMARSIPDLELIMPILCGPGGLETMAWRLDLPGPRASRLKDFRVAVLPNSNACEVDHDIEGAVMQVAENLRSEGTRVDLDVEWPVDLERAWQDFMVMMRAVASRSTSAEDLRRWSDDVPNLRSDDRSYKAAVRRAAGLSHREWLFLHGQRNSLRVAWRRFFQDYDIVLCPVHSSLAFAHDTATLREDRVIDVNGRPQDYNQSLFWMAIASLGSLPSTVRPVSLARGLPIGIQIIGPYLEDRTTLRFADLLGELCQPLRFPLEREVRPPGRIGGS